MKKKKKQPLHSGGNNLPACHKLCNMSLHTELFTKHVIQPLNCHCLFYSIQIYKGVDESNTVRLPFQYKVKNACVV